MGTRTVDINGLQATAGDHICVFYRGEAERHRIMLPFLKDGLRAGDKCLCITSPGDHRRLASSMGERDPGLLHFEDARRTYAPDGSFTPERMLDFWSEWGRRTFDEERHQFGRAVTDMSWAEDLFTPSTVRDFMDYEVQATRYARQYPQIALCLYDIDRFGGNVIIPALRVHPKVLFAGILLENPYYVDPDEASGA